MRILVVEDTDDIRDLLVDLLEVDGYTVDSAINGIEGLEKALASPPDLIISDILMPEMDGFEFCKNVKKEPQLMNIPFIFYTATYTDPRDQRFALSLGADRFIIKPEDPFKLLNNIKETLEQHKDFTEKNEPYLNESEDDYFETLHKDSLARKLDKKVQDLENQKEQLRIITDSIPALIAEIDTTGCYKYVNLAYENWFQRSRKDIIGKKISEVVNDSEYKVIQSYVEQALSGEEVSYEGFLPDKDGKPRYILARYIPYKNKEKIVKGCFLFINDITEQKAAEEEKEQLLIQLRNAQKMDALGQLTSGIAHDFNNMLGIINGYAEVLNDSFSAMPDQAGYIREIQLAAERGTKLTRKLLSFTHQKSMTDDEININDSLIGMQNVLERTLTSRIKLVLDLAENLDPVYLDSGDLDDAILNMSINAMHAIDKNGSLTIKTYNENINDVEAHNLNLKSGKYVVLSLTDTGSGIDEATKEKLFEPLFTTKGKRGTGLGLSQVYGFVHRSGGAIMVYSEPGQGAHFVLYFPRSNADKSILINDFQ